MKDMSEEQLGIARKSLLNAGEECSADILSARQAGSLRYIIPFHALNMWVVPAAEIGVGVLFISGFLWRLASLAAIVMMGVATYVHLAVNDPTLFPLQPEAPIIPAIVIALCLYLLWIGRESWRLDFRAKRADGK